MNTENKQQDMLKYNLRNLKLPISDICYLVVIKIDPETKEIEGEEAFPFTGFFDAKYNWRYIAYTKGRHNVYPFIINVESSDLHIPKGIPNDIKTIILEKYSAWLKDQDDLNKE